MKDPLKPTSPSGRALFEAFGFAADGMPADEVISASANMIVNCLRQNYGSRRDVEARMVELHNRMMGLLMEHYDPATDRRRSVIPFNQVVRPSRIVGETNFLGLGPGRKNGASSS